MNSHRRLYKCILATVAFGLCFTPVIVSPALSQHHSQAHPHSGSMTVPIEPKSTSSLSVNAPTNEPEDYMSFKAYNNGHRELNLWGLEARRFIRSEPAISPDKAKMAYSEVTFMPDMHQTFSTLYLVPINNVTSPTLPPMPEDQYGHTEKTEAEKALERRRYTERYDPNQTLKRRQKIFEIGKDKAVRFRFQTLTVVDWSSTGNRLLFKLRQGVQHMGLTVSEIMVYDSTSGTVTIYPELKRVLIRYWKDNPMLPKDLNKVAWDIYPLGWESGSDSAILFKSWVFYRNEKQFLGTWRYDLDTQQAMLVTLNDGPVPVASNGYIASVDPTFEIPQKETSLWSKIKFWDK